MNILFYVRHRRDADGRGSCSGFTMTELLIVIVIGAILSAIAIPSMLSQAAKARQAEGKTFIGTINRAQQAYVTEKSSFADDISYLGILSGDDSKYYNYALTATPTQASVVGTPLDEDSARIYTGAAAIDADTTAIRTIICESPSILSNDQDIPTWDATTSSLQCPNPMVAITQ